MTLHNIALNLYPLTRWKTFELRYNIYILQTRTYIIRLIMRIRIT